MNHVTAHFSQIEVTPLFVMHLKVFIVFPGNCRWAGLMILIHCGSYSKWVERVDSGQLRDNRSFFQTEVDFEDGAIPRLDVGLFELSIQFILTHIKFNQNILRQPI